ncbi:hypothetical protein ACGFR8_21385 [Streptomyces brevispora]|uniref:hypothetical protein n=1 Tax=Streptomyces brevispora TaxID=887462 RepID=UPI003710D3B9
MSERHLAVEHWLLSAARDRKAARTEWNQRNVALLPCGTLFSAVRVPAALVQAAAGSTDLPVIDAFLGHALLEGPVICDRYADWYYALVPASTADRWKTLDAVCLGRESSLGVPRPGRTAGARVYWSVPMDSPAMLCTPHAVTQLIAVGRYRSVNRPAEVLSGVL